MKNSKAILDAMRDGREYSVNELMEITGLTQLCVHAAVSHLRHKDYLASRPVIYQITPKGEKKADHVPSARALRRREQRKAEAPAQPATWKTSSAPRVNSVFALGGLHA